MKKKKTVDVFVRVDPKPPIAFFLWRSVNNQYDEATARERYEEYALDEYRSDCKAIEQQIRRHVDDFGSVSIEYTTENVCSFCGSRWTEGDGTHNGGCCEQDGAVMLAEDKPE
jgi:hypothetical protein